MIIALKFLRFLKFKNFINVDLQFSSKANTLQRLEGVVKSAKIAN